MNTSAQFRGVRSLVLIVIWEWLDNRCFRACLP